MAAFATRPPMPRGVVRGWPMALTEVGGNGVRGWQGVARGESGHCGGVPRGSRLIPRGSALFSRSFSTHHPGAAFRPPDAHPDL